MNNRLLVVQKVSNFLFLVWSFLSIIVGFVFFAIFGFVPNIKLAPDQISTFFIFSLSLLIVWVGLAGLCFSIKFFIKENS